MNGSGMFSLLRTVSWSVWKVGIISCLLWGLPGGVRGNEVKTILMIEQEDPARPAYSAFMGVFRPAFQFGRHSR